MPVALIVKLGIDPVGGQPVHVTLSGGPETPQPKYCPVSVQMAMPPQLELM